jgi:advillin
VDRGSVTLLCTEEQEELYNGDCYIVQYSYVEDGKDYNLFFSWSGQNSVQVYCILLVFKNKATLL